MVTVTESPARGHCWSSNRAGARSRGRWRIQPRQPCCKRENTWKSTSIHLEVPEVLLEYMKCNLGESHKRQNLTEPMQWLDFDCSLCGSPQSAFCVVTPTNSLAINFFVSWIGFDQMTRIASNTTYSFYNVSDVSCCWLHQNTQIQKYKELKFKLSCRIFNT